MARSVNVSFGEDDEQLYQKFKHYCKEIGSSKYIKIALREKIEREENIQMKIIDDFIKNK